MLACKYFSTLQRNFCLFVVIITSFHAVSYALNGSGTEADPYVIASVSDFDEFAGNPDFWDDHIRLKTDIDLSGKTYTTAVIAPDTDNSDTGFTGTQFSGVFDGDGHKILNLNINSLSTDNAHLGLFGSIHEYGIVKDLNLDKAVIASICHIPKRTKYVGSLCGLNSGIIENCNATVTISVDHSAFVGGLVGHTLGTIVNSNVKVNISVGDRSGQIGGLAGFSSDCLIENTHSTGIIATKYASCIGGLVGTNIVIDTTGSFSTIINCSSNVDITTLDNSFDIGGLVGLNQNPGSGIAQSYASGAIYSGGPSEVLGGLCGKNTGGVILNSYARGQVSGYKLVGGLCGNNQSDGVIYNCYSTGIVTGDSDTGGFCGGQSGTGSVMSNCFWDIETSGKSIGFVLTPTNPGYVDNVVGKTTVQMNSEQVFLNANWDFLEESANGIEDLWHMPYAGIGYPMLIWQKDIPGDFTGEYGVNFVDFALFAGDWLTTESEFHLWSKKTKLTASDGAAGDYLGIKVAIDGGVAIVGAYGDDDKGSYSGSAYLFDAATGEQIAKLTASDGAAGDWFGGSVAIDGGVAVVSAHGNDDDGSNSGSAYLFDAVTGEQIAKLTASDGAAGDFFGCSVAIDGGVVVVGASYDDDRGGNSGSAYLFDAVTGEQIAKLTASDGAGGDWFGISVAIDGGIAVIGAYDDDRGTDSGSAYLFDTVTGEQIAKLTASDGAADDYFSSVAIDGGVVVVGAYGDDDSGSDSGSAYLFDAFTGEQKAKFTASDGAAGDRFGLRVAIDGGVVIVGADGDDDRGTDSGSAYLFDTVTGEQIAKLTASNGVASRFGCSVAFDGDVAIVGAYGNDDRWTDSGSAYLFSTLIQTSTADFDSSGVVDIVDLLVFADHWLKGIPFYETTPPTPNPASFDSLPTAISETEISMTALEGEDLNGPVE